VTSFYSGFEASSSDEPATNYQSNQVAILTTPTLICTVEGNESGVLVNNAGAAAVFLGGPAVTTTTGLSVGAGATVTVPTYGGAKVSLYGIAAATGNTVSFLHPTA
jgi:hypothetical protein